VGHRRLKDEVVGVEKDWLALSVGPVDEGFDKRAVGYAVQDDEIVAQSLIQPHLALAVQLAHGAGDAVQGELFLLVQTAIMGCGTPVTPADNVDRESIDHVYAPASG